MDGSFVERRFELGDRQVIARFYAPTLEPGGEYKCRWEIEWPDSTQRRYASGNDSVQAIMLAMRAVHGDLAASDAYRAGALTYVNQRDLDLPPLWGAGPLYEAGPKPHYTRALQSLAASSGLLGAALLATSYVAIRRGADMPIITYIGTVLAVVAIGSIVLLRHRTRMNH